MSWKSWCFGVFVLLFLLHPATSESEQLLPGSGSGIGSGSGLIGAPDPPTCDKYSATLDVTLFDGIIDNLQELNCQALEEGYEVVFWLSAFGLELFQSDTSVVFGDYFEYDDDIESLSIEVCTYDILATAYCNEELISVSLTISSYSERLLPFAGAFAEGSITNADDRAEGVFLSNPIPFWGRYYTSVYVSTNGVVSFGRPFTRYWPVVFPYGSSSVPLIAPYWNDLDFRNGIKDSGLYYTTYASSGTKRDQAFLQEFSERISAYSDGDTTFNPTWMLVATWYKVTPYYGRSNVDETLTFQVLLASDSVDTYTVFLYREGGINWNRDSREIVIGYDSKDYVNYLNVEDSDSFTEIDIVTGNTGNMGEWYFRLIDPDSDLDPEQECFKWVGRQEKKTFEDYFEGLPSCPCTWSQARRDWRFWFGWRWGLSSGPNCATLVWSRRQSTVECCYDESSGALLVEGPSGGSYKLHHPLFSNREYITEDKQPFEYCCQSSKLCSMFYAYRPSDDCSGYDPSEISFTWGDPHFTTVDGLTYTFNGFGEYILLESDDNDLTVQVRLVGVDMASTGTKTSAVVVVQGTVQPVQVDHSEGSMILYIGGTAVDIPSDDEEGLIITDSTMYDSFMEFIEAEQTSVTSEYISVHSSDENLIISTSTGASVMVSSSVSVLHLAVEVSNAFVDSTQGLLGYLNGNPSDDFYRPDGTVLATDSSEQEIFEYGKLWHVGEADSEFEYFDGDSYSTHNEDWDTHVPTFSDAVDPDILDDVETVCEGNPQCIFDYGVTNDISFATATYVVSMENEETQNILNNSAPTISGPPIVYVTRGEIFEQTFTVYDADGHDITAFELVESGDLTLEWTAGNGSALLVWDTPDSELPETAVRILANDSMGAATLHPVSVVLCACVNNGTCNNDSMPLFDTNGHFLQECMCGELFSGELCENDERGCSDDSCPEFSMCVEDNSVDVGFNCSSCQEGYELGDDGKCTDIDECDMEVHGCMHTCNNTQGSYECLCDDGYELMENGRNCTDIDECYEGTDDCGSEQMCINTEGSYECDCYYPLSLSTEGYCTAAPCAGCGASLSCNRADGLAFCLCLTYGEYCVGDCNGTLIDNDIEDGMRSCEECMPNRYGYRCKKGCDCEPLNGVCNSVEGCVCHAGYTGHHCESEINEATPVFVKGTIKALTLSWNLPEGAVLAQFNATDMDVGRPGEVKYSLYHDHQLPSDVSSGEGIFTIDSETGVLVLEQDLNTTRELYKRFALAVVATDLALNPRSSEIIVSVSLEDTPAPIPSFNEALYMVEISENVPDNSIVLNFTCAEPEEATGRSNLTTRLSQSNDSQLFSLEGEYDDLMLVLSEKRDYEALEDTTVPHYTLEVTCSNQYEITASATIEIEILNEDDNSFEFENSTYYVVVPENVERYYQVLIVTAFDPDLPDGSITYDAMQPKKFSIFPNGTVYVTDSVDREAKDSYILNIEAKLDSSGEITEAVVNITISDINEGPPIFSNDLYTSDNLSTAITVGEIALTVVALDSDFKNNGSVLYSIEENALFAINNRTGVVYINNASVVSLYGSYVLEVYATDEGDPPMSSTSRVDIYVAPIPDRIEFQDIPSTIAIHEDKPRGYEIRSIVAVVVDRNGDVIVDAQTVGDVEYELMPTSGYENFHIGQYSGNLILLNSLDFEEVKSYNLTVVASIPNYAGATINSTTTIEVLVVDVNDNAPVFTPSFYTAVVEEFTRVGKSVLTVHADDEDSGNNAVVTYRLKDAEDLPFAIDSVNGTINITSSLDTPLDYRFYVVAEDSGISPRSSETVVFVSVVRSLSVVPQFDRQMYTFRVPENSPPGTEIGSVLAHVAGNNSIDEYTHLKYRLMDASSMFHVDPDLGTVSVLSALDAEHQSSYIIHAEVYNDTHVFDNATIQVHVEDMNDHSPQFRQSLYTDVIATDEPQHSVLFNVSADDGDEPGSKNSLVQYSFAESNTIGFGINLTTGSVYIVNSTLYAGDYHLTAIATDEGDPHMSGTVLVFISVIPAGPQSILFEESEYEFDVSEDAEPGSSVGRVVALDHNLMPFPEGSDLRYHFSDATPNFVQLTVGQMTGDILVSSSLDRENQSSYTLVVIAEFEGNQTGEVSMTVNVLDINDNPPIFTKDVYAEGIETTYGNSRAILQVIAVDSDANLNGRVQYAFSDGETETDQFRITDTGEIYSLTETIPAGDYRLVVTASDSNPTMPETSTAIVSICVYYQEPAESLEIVRTVFRIPENSPAGTEVGTVQVVAGGITIVPEHYRDNLEFSIGEDYFVINESNGTLKLVGALDYEMKSSYSFEVTATFNDYGLHVTRTLTIEVIDVNDNTPVFNPLLYSAIIDDGYTDNQRVPTDEILVTDIDYGSNAQLYIYFDEINPFGIRLTSNTTGELSAQIIVSNTSLLQPDTAYIFNIIASDRGNPPETAVATVRIQVEYALPDMIYFPQPHYSFNYTEHSLGGTEVGSISVLPDTPALDELVYSVSDGSGMFVFHIHQYSGVISNHFSLDREQEDEYSLTITAQLIHHPTPLSATTTVTVTVLDINDNIPIFDRSSYSAVVYNDELVTNVPIINVSASDTDIGENSDISYSITDPGVSFEILGNGSIFATSTSLGVNTYSLTVVATDMGDEPLTGSTIVLIDIRPGIPDSIAFSKAQYNFNVSEYDTSGTRVGEVELYPPLPTEFVQYRSFSSDSDDFVVVTQSGVVQSRRQFDYEYDETVIEFQVTCTLNLPHENGVTLNASASVVVNVLDENDNVPQFTNFPVNLAHRENVTQEEPLTQIMASDADSGTNADLVFSIANDVLVRIDPSTGDLYVRPGLDREQQEVHTVSVLVTDQGSDPNSYQSDFTLTLIDINDNIPVLVQTAFSVDERVSGIVVFQLEYRDSDEGEYGRAIFSQVSGQPDSRFTVDSTSGQITINQPLDYEVEQSVELLIELVDNPENLSDSHRPHYTVLVNVLDKPDNAPEFAGIEQSLAIDPGITQGDTLVIVSATDEDDDEITYAFENTDADFITIDSNTGEITYTATTTLQPGTNYNIQVKATDESEYGLSSTIDIIITIDARSLTFESEVYASSIPEDTRIDTSINQLKIQELARSNDYEYSFSYKVISPPSVTDPFTSITYPYRIDIHVNAELDREAVPSYILQVNATRFLKSNSTIMERLTINFTITIEDVNDNRPVISQPQSLYYISEDDAINTVVTQVVASDSDIGSNKELEYFIISPSASLFEINQNDGTITVGRSLDFESQEMHTLTVQVEDLGTPSLSSTAQFTIEVQNVNDVPPAFAALAYFGELYTRAPANSDVIHVVLEVSDLDGDTDFTFSISPDPSDSSAKDYSLSVRSQPPYHVIANRIPSNAQTGLRRFIIEVSDHMNKNSTVLHLGVFAQEHLLPMTVSGQSKEDFLTIVPNVLRTLNNEFSSTFGQPVSYYYQSIDESSTDTTVLMVTVYGWYGGYGTRYNNGKEETRELSNSVFYVTYSGVDEQAIASAVSAAGDISDLEISVGEVPVSSPTAEPPTAAADNTLVMVGIISGAVVAVLLIVLLIVLISVFGRRRKPKPEKDLYSDLSHKRRKRAKGPGSFALTQKGTNSDLAYETMFDEDDEMLNQEQTMPWFDPNYAANENDDYDGDGEGSSFKGGPLRATVDGDARKPRRDSTEKAPERGSVMELDRSKYLDSYQQSTPMQPGQRMGEYDMFLNRNAVEAERPRRPSLGNIAGMNAHTSPAHHAVTPPPQANSLSMPRPAHPNNQSTPQPHSNNRNAPPVGVKSANSRSGAPPGLNSRAVPAGGLNSRAVPAGGLNSRSAAPAGGLNSRSAAPAGGLNSRGTAVNSRGVAKAGRQ